MKARRHQAEGLELQSLVMPHCALTWSPVTTQLLCGREIGITYFHLKLVDVDFKIFFFLINLLCFEVFSQCMRNKSQLKKKKKKGKVSL